MLLQLKNSPSSKVGMPCVAHSRVSPLWTASLNRVIIACDRFRHYLAAQNNFPYQYVTYPDIQGHVGCPCGCAHPFVGECANSSQFTRLHALGSGFCVDFSYSHGSTAKQECTRLHAVGCANICAGGARSFRCGR